MKVNKKMLNVVYPPLFSALITVCSWICLSFPVPFTLQTFAVFLTLLLIGGKSGTVAVIIYILLGLAGLPVFSGFTGGVGVLFGPTGGYITGFLLLCLIYRGITAIFGTRTFISVTALICGLFVCYLFGSLWFMIYSGSYGIKEFLSALWICVIPFIIPDTIKLLLAIIIARRVKLHTDTGNQTSD